MSPPRVPQNKTATKQNRKPNNSGNVQQLDTHTQPNSRRIRDKTSVSVFVQFRYVEVYLEPKQNIREFRTEYWRWACRAWPFKEGLDN